MKTILLFTILLMFFSCDFNNSNTYNQDDILKSKWVTTSIPPVASGKIYYVNKSGNDDNGGSNRSSDACLTIQRGISLLSPGDALYIGEGSYKDSANESAYLTPGTRGYFSSSPDNTESFTMILDRSGTITNPIVIMADPQNTKQVILDGGHIYGKSHTYRGGVFLNYQDYIHFLD